MARVMAHEWQERWRGSLRNEWNGMSVGCKIASERIVMRDRTNKVVVLQQVKVSNKSATR